jgi:uncharacterized protein (DUF305 family)
MKTDDQRLRRLAAGLLVAALLATWTAACGGDDGDGTPAAKGTPTESAFLKAMIPHHEAAVEMAEIAKERARHDEIRRRAADIVAAQNREITQMEGIYERLFGAKITPDPEAHDQLGLSASEAGMEHVDHAELEAARPFDRAFIDEMVPHHQGAIRMARIVTVKSDDAEIDRLAQAIIDAQSREIREISDWRTRWYGKPSPAGGVPPDGEGSSGAEEEHGGGHSG